MNRRLHCLSPLVTKPHIQESSSCNIKYRNGQKQLRVFVLHALIHMLYSHLLITYGRLLKKLLKPLIKYSALTIMFCECLHGYCCCNNTDRHNNTSYYSFCLLSTGNEVSSAHFAHFEKERDCPSHSHPDPRNANCVSAASTFTCSFPKYTFVNGLNAGVSVVCLA